MDLTRHNTPTGARWALDGKFLRPQKGLAALMQVPLKDLPSALEEFTTDEEASGAILSPVEHVQEVWAAGVTYLSSRMAREAESQSADVYQKVYNAERPELFFKSSGGRVVGDGEDIRVRADSAWDVPEPELTLAINIHGEVIGYTVGNDVSSRSIEGENPLYLPQAKVYDGSCAIGPCIRLASLDDLNDLPIELTISRANEVVFSGETKTSQIKRGLDELVEYLYRELSFPMGSFLMTGTGVVPTEEFTLQSGDRVRIEIGGLVLENPVG